MDKAPTASTAPPAVTPPTPGAAAPDGRTATAESTPAAGDRTADALAAAAGTTPPAAHGPGPVGGPGAAPARTVPRAITLTVAPGSARISHIPAVTSVRIAPATTGPRPGPTAAPAQPAATSDVTLPPAFAPAFTATAEAPAPSNRPAAPQRIGFSITADGGYGACLVSVSGTDAVGGTDAVSSTFGMAGAESTAGSAGGGWMVERWTLDAAAPYVVPLPRAQPEEPGTGVAPLADGRVLVLRAVADRYDAVLLYPAGPGTGETRIGSLAGGPVRLLPPSPAGDAAHVLLERPDRTEVWQVVGAPGGEPAFVMAIDGRCSGGVWLDRAGRLLALDRTLDGRTKTVAADLHTGDVTPLLHLTDRSDDRLVLAEPDSGLLVLRSDAPGRTRLGWGVLGSNRPVRFPDALCPAGALVTPVAVQPGRILDPESAVVALRAQTPDGSESLALWRPGERHVHWQAAPEGWLGGAGLWDATGLRLPYADTECGFVAYAPPPPADEAAEAAAGGEAATGAEPAGARGPVPRPGTDPAPDAVRRLDLVSPGVTSWPDPVRTLTALPAAPRPRVVKESGRPRPTRRPPAVLPLQQAPLSAGRV